MRLEFDGAELFLLSTAILISIVLWLILLYFCKCHIAVDFVEHSLLIIFATVLFIVGVHVSVHNSFGVLVNGHGSVVIERYYFYSVAEYIT